MKAALVYASRGWAVVPLHGQVDGVCSCSAGASCPSAGKHPRIRDWAEAASSDPSVITEWAQRWPTANIGVATGEASGFWALDVDPKNGGLETIAALEAEHGPLPVTPQQRTGSGGAHYIFALPDFAVPNTAGRIGSGLDTRGNGGQIVVAPSVSAKGRYAWVPGRAPWEVDVAPAPEWLLAELRKRPQRASAPVKAAALPAFPPASAEVLDDARDALELHGPAIEGQGGDAHTYAAACLLVNDFALGDTEALPLLVEWNETCQPPWSTEQLEEKLANASKYATKPYGCRRGQEVLAAVRGLIAAWRDAGALEHRMFEMLEEVRLLMRVCSDPAKRQFVAADVMQATGLKAAGLGFPKAVVTGEEVPAGTITVGVELHTVANEATKAIHPHVFARSGVLCEVVRGDKATFISDLEPARIVDLMSSSAKWARHDDKGVVSVSPPAPVAAILHARRSHAGVRVLEGVTTSPVFLADGSILQERGYNAESRLFLEPDVEVFVPDEPTRDDARASAVALRQLLSDFRFRERADFSAWLAGLLSPLVKSATGNAPAPLVCVSAPSRGAGKSLLVNIASRIVTGKDFEQRPYNPRDPAEWGKRVTAFVRAGAPIGVFDNITGLFGDETLDKLLTSATWSDRVLGVSDAPPVPIVTCWWANGNNIEPHGDTVRRVMVVQLEVREERPQERSGFAIREILTHVLQHRAEFLTHALTILRAYHVAGRPPQAIPEWGSFEVWSALVRGALVWTGLTDPYETQRRAASELYENENEEHDLWLSCVDGTDGTAVAIIAAAEGRNVRDMLGLREQLTPRRLRARLRPFIDKPRRERRIRRAGERFIVETISA